MIPITVPTSPFPISSHRQSAIPSFLIGGVASGCGKTTISLGIMAALKARGYAVQPFKCGPDFIDPSLHRMVTGTVSSNLDLCMCGHDFCKHLFNNRLAHHNGKRVAVVEGVMGLFDGGESSSAALATTLNLPVVLVVDARSAAESVAAVVKGFELYDPSVQMKGVIFNRVGSPHHAELIRGAMEQACQAKIIGFFPRDIRFTIPERHLGLHMGEESPLDEEQLTGLITAIEEHLDLDALLTMGSCAVPSATAKEPAITEKRTLVIAVARDEAFCFYYEDNFQLLKKAGFEFRFFSPLHDQQLPEGIDTIYLGGGYPELHAAALSRNTTMLAAITAWAQDGGVIYAECGGFMYLCETIIDLTGTTFPMAGVFPATVRMQDRLSRLGYRHPCLLSDCLWGMSGDRLHGHEFHYSTIEQMAPEVETLYQLESGKREGYRIGNTVGGYMHLHFGQSERNLAHFYNFIMATRKKRKEMEVNLQQIKPLEIEAESFRIIESEFTKQTGRLITEYSREEFAIIRRVIHATGDFTFAANLRFHPQAIASGIAAIRAGKNVLTDVNMVAAGISSRLLHPFGGTIICRVGNTEVAAQASRFGRTRSETAMAIAKDDNVGIIAIGNAPTALLATMELIEAEFLKPDLVVGVPVGFVNAAESKEILAQKQYPFITALGRKGGSPVAAAIINALLRLA